jgi:hypothetical protein
LNIVISSPQPSGGGGARKSGDNVDASVRDAGEMPSQLRTCSDSTVRVSMASPNRTRNLDAQQSTSIRSQEQDSSKFKRHKSDSLTSSSPESRHTIDA